MMHCPQQHGLLERAGVAGAFVWVCRQCGGRAVTMPVLRRQVGPAFANELWRQATATAATGVACPSCLQTTAAVGVTAGDQPVELDVCPQCTGVWFDPGERERIPDRRPPEPPLPPNAKVLAARQQAAIAEVEAMARRARERADEEPGLQVSRLPALLGLPVVLGSGERSAWPWLTWTTGAIVAVVSITGFFEPGVVQTLQLVPRDLGDSLGLTMLSAFFVHAGWLHLLGNLWFLVVFGDDVEQRYGRARWLALVISATVLGALVHVMIDARSSVPCVGASGGISGLIVSYGLIAPDRRLGTWFWLGLRPFWVTFSARTGLVVWLVLQVWLLVKQLMGVGDVSAAAHLGGVAAGVLAWLHWRRPEQDSRAT